jgi:hypothetical protein
LQELARLIEDSSLKYAIEFVDRFDTKLKPNVSKVLYEEIILKNLNGAPEMLLLQKKIRQLEDSETILKDTKERVDADCRKIISRIVKGIGEKDYSISRYIAKSIDPILLDDNMATIVREFSTGTLDNTLLLIQYSQGLRYIYIACTIYDAVLDQLEKRQLLKSEQAMQLWAHAKYIKEETANYTSVTPMHHKVCTIAFEKLSLNKEHFFRHYQKYVENSDKQKIIDLHKSNVHLQSIVRDFVSFYYNGDVGRTKNLLAAAHAITYYFSVGRILSQLHQKMAKNDQLNSFEAFRLFNEVKRRMGSSNFKPIKPAKKITFEQLKELAPAWVRQLLWPKVPSKFIIVNKFTKKQLLVSESDKRLLNWTSEQDNNGAECGWWVTIDLETSLVTFSLSSGLKLGLENKEAILSNMTSNFMISAEDEQHVMIFKSKGV